MKVLMVMNSHDKTGKTGRKTRFWLQKIAAPSFRFIHGGVTVFVGSPVAAVCHAPGVLHRVKINGQPIVKGKRVTGFTNEEEEEVHLTHVVPFLVEDELKRLGGRFEKVANWQVFTVVDGLLITGQNPASSGPGAADLINLLKQRAAA